MEQFTCPSCGAHLQVTPTGTPWQKAMSFNLGDSSAVTGWTRTTPHRAPTPAGDVIVPVAQAAVTGTVTAIAVSVFAVANGWSWLTPIGAGAVVMAIAWLVLLFDHRSLLRVVESITSGGDDRAEEQDDNSMHLDITEHRDGGDGMRFLDLPCDPDTMAHIARGVLAGHKFSERSWAGKNKPISGPKFRKLQDILLSHGYLRWNSMTDHRQGVSPTHKGEQLFRGISDANQ